MNNTQNMTIPPHYLQQLCVTVFVHVRHLDFYSENDVTTINSSDNLWLYLFFAPAGQIQVQTPLGFTVLSPGELCCITSSFLSSLPNSLHLLSHILDVLQTFHCTQTCKLYCILFPYF